VSGSSGPLHPRQRHALQGVDGPAKALQAALDRGRLHHAWLLTGPEGVGKASFAYQVARRLLGARAALGGDSGIISASDDPVSRMVAAQSHPDLMVLERWSEANPSRKSIPVDEARKLPEFFSKAPAIGDYRVAIIDSADDLSVNAANAVLKTLEEPSGRGVLLLVSHAPGRLLPTIRSRCRRLIFRPWPDEQLADFIVETLNLPPSEALRLAAMSGGAPGRSLSLAAQGAMEVDQQIGQFLSSLPNTDSVDLLNLVDSFRGGEGAVRFHLVLERLTSRLHAASSNLARSGAGAAAERWSMVWTRAMALSSCVEDLNMDRPDAFWSLVADLKRVAQSDLFPC